MRLSVDAGLPSGKIVAELTDVGMRFGDKRLIEHFSATILRGDKVGLIGPNGVGKTTLLKLILGDLAPTEGKVFVFVGIDSARFKKPVFPGDQLTLKVEFARRIRTIWKCNTTAEVDGVVVATAELMVAPGQ